jgi:hypothetical protein
MKKQCSYCGGNRLVKISENKEIQEFNCSDCFVVIRILKKVEGTYVYNSQDYRN